jgi:hypothetical protein
MEKLVMFRISNFIKSQWLGIVLLIVFIMYSISSTLKTNKYIEEREKFKIKISSLELLANENKKLIDSLKRIDGVYVEKIKIIKQKEYEQIRIIDSLPASELQSYFSERYPE